MISEPIHQSQVDSLAVSVYQTNAAIGAAAAAEAGVAIRAAVEARGQANIIIATGNSQLSFLTALRAERDIDWSKVVIFHMDEYVGLPAGHAASFPTFLHQHLIDHISPEVTFCPVVARTDYLEADCHAYRELLRQHPADLCAMGIGENGHIAFNDPPFAEFDDPVWVKVVRLDEVSRHQQVGEGHFGGLDEVPTHAITLTIPALLSAAQILCIVPEARKVGAVRRTLTGPIEEACPASILRKHERAHLYLDGDSAGDLLG